MYDPKRFIALFALAFLSLVPPRPGEGKTPEGFVFSEDIPYASASDRQRLDILYPPDSETLHPAILFIHGGGWYTGGKGGERTFQLMRTLAEAGYVALSMSYRLSDEAPFPAAVQDCRRAIRWLRAHADRYSIDPRRIGAMGPSAGGHLSAMLAVTDPDAPFEGEENLLDESSGIQAAVPVCAPFDLRAPLSFDLAEEDDPVVVRFLGGPISENLEAARMASPIAHVHTDQAPLLIVHGDADRRVHIGQAFKMIQAMEEVAAPYETLFVRDGGHGMGIAREKESLERILAFFDRHLKRGQSNEAGLNPSVESEPKSNANNLEWFRNSKFGLFVHWGPSSLTGEEISWSRAGERPGLTGLLPGAIPRDEYDNLYRRFNPTDFNSEEWVSILKRAGMRYIVFTTKHHDGFCMFDSGLTDYKITNSPYQKDILAELAQACHEGGVGLGFYYSLPDWHHPDYKTDNHEEYIRYLHGQVRELCTNYGPIDILWFDGKRQGTPETWDSPRLVEMIRELQPEALINDRVWGDTDYNTPEQVIGRFQIDPPWESCITLGHQWSWKPDDQIKPWEECVRLLALAAGGGGNLMLNVGPMPTGAIEDRQIERLERIGEWIRVYGDAVYGTRPGPFPPSYWGASTHSGDDIYLHVFEGWAENLQLPAIEPKIRSSQVLGGGGVNVVQSPDGIFINIPDSSRRSPITIVKLNLDGPAADIAPKDSGIGIPPNTTATSSNIRRGEANYAPTRAVDDDPLSRWATDDGVTETWLEIQLPHPITFDVILMDEAFGPRVQSFRIQQREGGEWKTFYEGATIGRNWAGKMDPVTAKDLRLEILEASDGPTIRDIRFHYVDP